MREYRDVILDACLRCYSYDHQIEGTRASYMYEIVGLLPDKAFYHDAVLKSLETAEDDVDGLQRFRFAGCMVSDGDEHAKRVMHDCYNPGPSYGESIGIEFVEGDGIPGLLFVAEKMGALLLTKPDGVDLGWVISQSKEAVGEEATWDALRDAGRENPQIEAFREANEARQKSRGDDSLRKEILSMSYSALLNRIPASKFALLRKWGEHASDQELELAARGLVGARDLKEQLRHLRIFQQRQFPLPPDTLIALTAGVDRRIGYLAMRALASFTNPAVRELAFRIVKSEVEWRGEAIALLNKNFEPGDHETVLGWFEGAEDREVRHSFGIDLKEFWKLHPDENTEVRMLRAMYEKNPCSFCRERAVERLIALNALTEQTRAECACDANDDIRDLVR